MEFLSRGGRTPAPVHDQPAAHSGQSAGKSKNGLPSWVSRVVIVGGVLIVVFVFLWLAYSKINGAEAKLVNESRYQAVFLTNNQVYFGNITDLNNKFVVLTDVFYVETPNQGQDATAATNTNYTLRKLGTTELHSPEDKMIINREQMTFWENLKDSSQVVTKIKEYKANPDAANQPSGSN